MKSRKERSRSISTLCSDGPDSESEVTSKKRARFSRDSQMEPILDLLREDAERNEGFLKAFIDSAEKERKEHREMWELDRQRAEEERKEQRERWEREFEKAEQERQKQYESQGREFHLRQRQLDLLFAELEERKAERVERELSRKNDIRNS